MGCFSDRGDDALVQVLELEGVGGGLGGADHDGGARAHGNVLGAVVDDALGDEVRIHQVVANLLANARAHTPAGTPITVSVLSTDAGVEVSVADKGPGLSAEDQKRIFERFYRADSSRVRTGADGSGLGLSIVDAVMKAHGGTVSVDSELGKGASFTLFFPVN